MNNNKNIGSSNIGENLSPHKYQSSVVNISKPLDWKKEFDKSYFGHDCDDTFLFDEYAGDYVDWSKVFFFIEKVEQQAILNERTKTLEMLKDEPIEKVKILHESARRGYYIRTKDAGAYARNKFRRNLRDKIKENYR